MNYYVEEEASKAGYRPIEQDEWEKVVSEGFVYNDITKAGSRRYRIIELDERWYCWVTEPLFAEGGLKTWHTCWEFDSKIKLSKEDFQRYRWYYMEVEKYMREP